MKRYIGREIHFIKATLQRLCARFGSNQSLYILEQKVYLSRQLRRRRWAIATRHV